jgi:methylmalonyl-CoA mutase cobalamin-binding subunit
MKNACNALQKHIEEIVNTWAETGVPARATLHEIADGILKWRQEAGIPGLWESPPLMLAATLDDGFGHGIQIILKFAEAMGVTSKFLGLMQSPEKIAAACREVHPVYLGLTVLQLDTDQDLAELRRLLPEKIKIIAGGPVFKIDPELAERVGIDFIAKDAGAFMRLLLKTVKRL